MAKASKSPLPAVIEDLLQHPQQYSFQQTIFLLGLWLRPKESTEKYHLTRRVLRFRTALSLGFSVSDVEDIELFFQSEQEQDRDTTKPQHVRITGTFYGLYGATSPLPKFYTERLFDEVAHDKSAMRDFLDILNNQFYMLHGHMLSNITPWYKWKVVKDDTAGHMLMSLASYGDKAFCDALPNDALFLRYARFFFQQVRTTSGLQVMLSDIVNWRKITIHCNVVRMVKILQEQRLCLGQRAACLGEDTTIGTEVACYSDKILIEFYDMDMKTHERLRPNTSFTALLHALIKHYCRELTEYDVMTKLLPHQAHAACLGGHESFDFASLGHNTWLGFGGAKLGVPLPSVTAMFKGGF